MLGGTERENVRLRSEKAALFIIKNKTTVRAAASHLNISKSTVHKDVTERLSKIDPQLYAQVKEVLELNKKERHLRGGEATRQKYLKS